MQKKTIFQMDIKNKLIICVGISGSSKTTWSSQYIKDNSNILRINRDDIRKTLVGDLDGYYQREDLNQIEQIVTYIENHLFLTINSQGYSIIIDNTNLKQSYIKRWLDLFKDLDIQFKLFDISLEDAQIRVAHRERMHSFEDLGYIDKQFEQYKQIKQYLETNYKSQII